MKIFHIEDNSEIAEPSKVFFESLGHQYHYTLDAKKGLQAIRSNKYDIILLDLMMPNFSGFDVIDALEKDGILKNITVFVFSAMTLPKETEDKLLKQGIHTILRKPVFLSELIKKLELAQVH